jgi:hypothetical protein
LTARATGKNNHGEGNHGAPPLAKPVAP